MGAISPDHEHLRMTANDTQRFYGKRFKKGN